MIISFSLENWMSYREKVSFSMVASRERQHGNRLSKVEKYKTKILPVAALYGGNASGKTNFFKALNFAKMLVVFGTHPDSLIPVEPFKLDNIMRDRPSKFIFELLIGNIIYEFSFAVTRKGIIEEKLMQINSTTEKKLYYRHNGKIELDKSLAEDKENFFEFIFNRTRDNQLFLTNTINQNIEKFRPIYDWFRYNLKLIAPDSRFKSFDYFADEAHPLNSVINDILPKLDMGISHIGGNLVPFESINMPEPLKIKILESVKEGMTVNFRNEFLNERFVISRQDGELIAKKLMVYHKNSDGTEVEFEIRQESDGSQRVIDLLPAFVMPIFHDSADIIVIDELDRSLHTLLTRKLLEAYLSKCSAISRKQLLFTTHDILLMDQHIFRRDEMWVTERNGCGASDLFSFNEYKKIRYDKDIRKSYLQGRLGGIPRISIENVMGSPCIA